jgi:hypothetical protein
MTYATGMRRTRGGLSGLLLILLGAWGALVPFVGPYFHYAYTPDRTWAYTSGRLWLEVVPGVATVLGGLIVLMTRSRAWGCCGAFLAALAGAWFVVGAAVTAQFVKGTSIRPGVPVATSAGAAASSLRQFLEGLGFFTGTGILIVFFAALALGRFSATSVTADAETDGDGLVGDATAGSMIGQQAWTPRETTPDEQQAEGRFPASQDQYPTVASQYPAGSQPSPAGQAPPRQDLFGRPEEQYQETTGHFPASSPTGQLPASAPTGEFPSSSSADSGES